VTKIPDYLEIEQVDEILRAAANSSTRDYLLLRFMWRTGVRVSEVINVTPKDVEFKNRVVHIRKATGGRQRRVPLDEERLKMLSDYVSAKNIGGSTYFPYQSSTSFQLSQEIWKYDRY
jgi:integrase